MASQDVPTVSQEMLYALKNYREQIDSLKDEICNQNEVLRREVCYRDERIERLLAATEQDVKTIARERVRADANYQTTLKQGEELAKLREQLAVLQTGRHESTEPIIRQMIPCKNGVFCKQWQCKHYHGRTRIMPVDLKTTYVSVDRLAAAEHDYDDMYDECGDR